MTESDYNGGDLDLLTDATDKLFTVIEANRALVLVRRIVADIVKSREALLQLRQRYEDLSLRQDVQDQLSECRLGLEEGKARLLRLRKELSEIGCILKDWTEGLVDFPSVHQGRRVWLCWRLGEAQVEHWHEMDEGFNSRRVIAGYFG